MLKQGAYVLAESSLVYLGLIGVIGLFIDYQYIDLAKDIDMQAIKLKYWGALFCTALYYAQKAVRNRLLAN